MAYKDLILGTSGVVGYWPLTESSGTTANDLTTNSNGTNTGGTVGQTGPLPREGTTATVYSGGASAGCAIPDVAAQHCGDVITHEFWTKQVGTSFAGGAGLQLIGGGTAVGQVGSFVATNAVTVRALSVANITTSTTTITDTNWHHIAYTKNGATTKLYIDGVDVTGAVTNTTLINSAGIGIAESNTGNNLNAVFAHFALYNVALSQAALQQRIAEANRLGIIPRSSIQAISRAAFI